MHKERSYIQPSCTLEVRWQGSSLGNWIDREASQSIQFRLHCDDQSLEGDQELLQRFLIDVEQYVQRFLTKEQSVPPVHSVMGLRLSTLQLVDVSNALEALSAEIAIVPTLQTAPSQPQSDVARSVAIGIFSVLIGISLGAWLASRSSRSSIAPVVLAPDITPTTIPPSSSQTPTPFATPFLSSSPVLPSPTLPAPRAKSSPVPPVRVYPRPAPVPLVKPNDLPESLPPPPDNEKDRIIPSESTAQPIPRKELLRTELQKSVPANPESPQNLVKSDLSYRRLQIQQVELSSSPDVTQSFLTHLQVLAIPPDVEAGFVIVDLSVEMGQLTNLTLENPTITDTASLERIEQEVRSWSPPPEQSGRVRIQVRVP